MIGTVWNSHFAASNALFGQFIQNYAQQSVVLRGIMRNWDEARIDAFMRLDVNDVRDFYFADLANRANAWGKLFDNGAETIENALVTRYIAETNRNAQVVGYVSGTALGRKTFKAINRLTLLAPPSTKPVVFVENMQDLLLSGKLSAEIDNGVVVIKARPDNGAWDEVARLSPDMSDATPVSNFQPADIRQTIYDPATGYSMALVCSGPRCSWVEGACFTAGTPVHTPGGLVPIEKISIGDTVLAYNESSKTPTLAPVTNVFHKTWRGLLRIIAGRDTLLATPNHPFYLPGSGRYLPADSLRRGMQLLALTGALLTVQSVAAVDTTVSVYNFGVAEHHNYYVGEEGVLVHNDCVLVSAGLRNAEGVTDDVFDVVVDALAGQSEVQIHLGKMELRTLLREAPNREELIAFFRGDDLTGLTAAERRAAQMNRVRAWDVLHTSDAIPAELKLNKDRLSDLARYLGNNPNNIILIRSELALAANVEQYLDYIKYVGTDLEHFYHTFRLYGDPQGRTWQQHFSWLNSSNTFKAGLPGYEGLTYQEVIDIVLQSNRYSNMTKSDAYISFAYTTGYFYSTVNDWIRNGQELALAQSIMDGVVASLQKLPKYEAGAVFYRGIKVKSEDLTSFLERYQEGQSVPENFIQSIASRVEDSFIGRPGYNVEFEIRGKINSPSEARDVHDFAWAKYWNSTNPSYPRTLSEGLFLPNAQLQVLEVLPVENGIYKFILQEL